VNFEKRLAQRLRSLPRGIRKKSKNSRKKPFIQTAQTIYPFEPWGPPGTSKVYLGGPKSPFSRFVPEGKGDPTSKGKSRTSHAGGNQCTSHRFQGRRRTPERQAENIRLGKRRVRSRGLKKKTKREALRCRKDAPEKFKAKRGGIQVKKLCQRRRTSTV